jgi:hypothetical protein
MNGAGSVALFRGRSAARQQCELALLERWGRIVPIYMCTMWGEVVGYERTALLAIRDEQGCWRSGVGITTSPARVVPGSYVMRVHRAGSAVAEQDLPLLAASLRQLADRSRMALQMSVEVFSRDPSLRSRFGAALAAVGFRPATEPLAYARTVVIELRDKDDAALLSSFHERARRHVRAMARLPIRVAPVTDVALAPRLQELLVASFARTGGTPPSLPWASILEASARHPELSRVAGLFYDGRTDGEGLLAFAWGCMHGDHARYDAAASTRRDDLRIPLGYGPVWDLLAWSRAAGATWFDFGGVTAGSAGSDDRLGGISDFKRGFSSLTEDVQEEWDYEPHPRLQQLANTIRRAARILRREGTDRP